MHARELERPTVSQRAWPRRGENRLTNACHLPTLLPVTLAGPRLDRGGEARQIYMFSGRANRKPGSLFNIARPRVVPQAIVNAMIVRSLSRWAGLAAVAESAIVKVLAGRAARFSLSERRVQRDDRGNEDDR